MSRGVICGSCSQPADLGLMRVITAIKDLRVPLRGDIANAVVNFSQHDVSLVAVTCLDPDAGPVTGFGFNSIGRFAQSGILRDRLIPRLMSADSGNLLAENGFFDPAAVMAEAMRNEKPGGHGDRAGAVAALELAIWDLNAKLAGLPAWQWIAGQTGTDVTDEGVPTYAAGGYYYADDSLDRLSDELRRYVNAGFDAFKIKIGGASLEADVKRFELAAELAGGAHRVAVDANGRFGREDARRYLEVLNELQPRWYEEPGDPLDYELNRELIGAAQIPIATGENLFSLQDTQNLLRYGGLRGSIDVLQMDAGLSYGLTEYLAMLALLEERGFSRSQCIPHGGHLINLHIVKGLGLGGCEAYPGVFQPLGGFSPQCLVADGTVSPSDAPGFGLEEKPELQEYLEEVGPQ